MMAPASVTSSTKSRGPCPCKVAMASLTSRALPTAKPKRLIHIGDDRAGIAVKRIADLHHRRRQFFGLLDRLHESAAAEFDVQKDRISPAGEFLRHDARSDERDAFDGPRHIAESIKFLIGRIDFGGLADDGNADIVHLLNETFFIDGD
jgi:hypothetical protein